MIALIDGDIAAYRSAASAENESLEIAIYRVNNLIIDILHRTESNEHEVLLSGRDNFRKKIDPEYKSNRTATRPKYLEPLREHLINEWGARVTDGTEADDAIAIQSKKYLENGIECIICSIDKDFRQIPGKHYRWEFGGTTANGKMWVKPEEFFYVTPLDGLKYFYKQLLIGDSSDNVIGVWQVGPKKADKYIDHLENEEEMFEVVRDLYKDDERLLKNGQLLWLLRTEEDQWKFPSLSKQ